MNLKVLCVYLSLVGGKSSGGRMMAVGIMILQLHRTDNQMGDELMPLTELNILLSSLDLVPLSMKTKYL